MASPDPAPTTAQALIHDPSSSSSASSPCRLITHPIPSSAPQTENENPENDQVQIRFLAAPINRVDLMVLAGQYPVKPLHTALDRPIPGFDGIATILTSSSAVFTPGDLVLPRGLGLGTWRTHAAVPASSLVCLPRDTPPIAGALLRSGAVVAWLLLEEVAAGKAVQSGEWIVVSAGTSAVAQVVAQLAARRGVNALLVVRDRGEEELKAVREKLLDLGAKLVLTESEFHESVGNSGNGTVVLPAKPVLALDSVFGPVGQDMAAALAPGGNFVLVGLLAGPAASITITTQHLFARQLSFLPFRSSEVLRRMGDDAVEALLARLAGMFADGTLRTPEVNVVDWTRAGPGEVEVALGRAVEAARSKVPGHVKTVWKLT